MNAMSRKPGAVSPRWGASSQCPSLASLWAFSTGTFGAVQTLAGSINAELHNDAEVRALSSRLEAEATSPIQGIARACFIAEDTGVL